MATKAPRHTNYRWTQDELVLALELYFDIPPTDIHADHPKIIALSDLLNTYDQLTQ